MFLPNQVEAKGKTAGTVVNISGKVLVRNENAGAQDKMKALKAGDSFAEGTIINTGSNGSAKLLMSDKTIMDIGPSTLFKVDEYELKNKDYSNRKVEVSMDYGKVRASVNRKISERGKFRFKTKAATMGVRGTEFIVASDIADLDLSAEKEAPKEEKAVKTSTDKSQTKQEKKADKQPKTQITVVSGKVAVRAREAEKPKNNENGEREKPKAKTKEVMVNAGSQLTAIASKPSDPKDRSPASKETTVQSMNVVTLSKAEMQTETKSARVVDNTFISNVVVDRSQGGAGAGLDTLAAIADNLTLPDDFNPTAGDLDFEGAFGPDIGFYGAMYTPQETVGKPVNVRVTFHK